jgi:hypothetical protein
MYNDGLYCDDDLLALALLSGDMACAADAVNLLRGSQWLRVRATAWYTYLYERSILNNIIIVHCTLHTNLASLFDSF